MNKPKILVADELHPAFKQGAQDLGFDVVDAPKITREEVLKCIADFDGIAIRTKFNIDKELMEAATRLKFVARAGAGMDNIDVEFAQQRNIKLINAPEGNCDAVGEHAVALLLSLMNNLRKADTEIRNGIWER